MEDRQTRLMLILAAVLVALVLVIRFVEPPGPEEDDALSDLIDLGEAEVTALTLVTDEGTLTAERSEQGWLLLTPIQARGDDAKLDALVRAIKNLRAEPPLEGADPAKYGLDTPRAAVTLRTADGEERRVDIGMKSPVGYKTYIRLGDGGVQVASGDPGSSAALPLGSFRDAGVIDVFAPAVTRLGWSSAANTWSVERRDGGWWLADGRRADARVVVGLLDHVGSLRFESFWEELSDEEAGLAPPAARLTLVDDTGERGLSFGAERAGGVLARNPAGVTGSVSGSSDLDLALGELLEARLVGATPAELTRVELQLGGARAEWLLLEGAWQRDGAPAADGGVGMIEALVQSQADRAARPEAFGEPSGSLTAWTPQGAITVALGQDVEGGRVGREGDGPLFLIPEETVAALESLLAG